MLVKFLAGICLFFFCACTNIVYAQELFVVTEPASNMPSHSIGVRAMNSFMKEKAGAINFHTMPEVMWGISHKLMLHVQTFGSTRFNGSFLVEGASFYGKYRLYSQDDFHEHLRVAAFARASSNRADIHQQEIETMGHNTGFELGAIVTKLKNKVAISSTVSFEQALNNTSKNKFPTTESSHATNYTFSVGKLMYPKSYSSLKQTNINLMMELLGQHLNSNGKTFLDAVPSVQFIFNSQARLDVAWRQQLYSTMLRTAPSGLIVKLEYTFFNVVK
jgi:hypothetical protein